MVDCTDLPISSVAQFLYFNLLFSFGVLYLFILLIQYSCNFFIIYFFKIACINIDSDDLPPFS